MVLGDSGWFLVVLGIFFVDFDVSCWFLWFLVVLGGSVWLFVVLDGI